MAYASDPPGANGFVALFDPNGTLIKTVEVGVGPDQIVFTADGSRLLVANEAEPVSVTLPGGGEQLINVEGGVSIIDLSGGAANASVSTTISFDALSLFLGGVACADVSRYLKFAETPRLAAGVGVPLVLEPTLEVFAGVDALKR